MKTTILDPKSIGVIFILLYLAFFGLYKLDELPGLHVDEAFFGIKGNLYNQEGIKEAFGMTAYTGILQSLLSAIMFKLFGLGVFQLRIAGVLLNLLALSLLTLNLIKRKRSQMAVVFLLFILQAGTLILFPRVAWEVNTFTLLFIILIMLAALPILTTSNFKILPTFTFMLINLVGTYNHILFSSLSLSMLIGMATWIYYNRDKKYADIFTMLFINAVNILAFEALLYLARKLHIGTQPIFTGFLFFTGVVLIQAVYIKNLIRLAAPVVRWIFSIKFPGWSVQVFLFVCLLAFFVFHGRNLINVASNQTIIVNLFSERLSELLTIILFTCAIIIVLSFASFLILDVFGKAKSLWGTILVTYLGVFNIYTTSLSLRYYLTLSFFICCFMAYEITKRGLHQYFSRVILTAVIISGVITNITVWNIYRNPDRKLVAMLFNLDDKTIDTSAHFLPTKPLMDFIRKNQIGNFVFLGDEICISRPSSFYKLEEGWVENPGRTAIIGYDYTNLGTGFIMKLKPLSAIKISKVSRKSNLGKLTPGHFR